MENTEFEQRVFDLTNEFRVANGRSPLVIDKNLDIAADEHTQNMAEQDFFSHTGKDGSRPWDRTDDAGYESGTVGENIAAGQRTPEQVVQAWIDSPGHRANMLNPNYNEIGIGHYYLENDTGSVNYSHYWTQVFGRGVIEDPPATEEPTPTEDDSTPPIELAPEPDVDTTPDASADEDMDTSPNADADMDLDTDAEADADADAGDVDMDTTPDASPDEDMDTTPDTDADMDLDTGSDVDADADMDLDTTPDSDSDADADTDSDADDVDIDTTPDSDADMDFDSTPGSSDSGNDAPTQPDDAESSDGDSSDSMDMSCSPNPRRMFKMRRMARFNRDISPEGMSDVEFGSESEGEIQRMNVSDILSKISEMRGDRGRRPLQLVEGRGRNIFNDDDMTHSGRKFFKRSARDYFANKRNTFNFSDAEDWMESVASRFEDITLSASGVGDSDSLTEQSDLLSRQNDMITVDAFKSCMSDMLSAKFG